MKNAWFRRTLFMVTATGMMPALPGFADEVPFSSDAWTIEAEEHRVEAFQGRETLFLKNGSAALGDVSFLNGVLEFEILVSPEQGFDGALWRIRENGNHEEFYIRPHQSGNPDANQYQPVFNGVAGWQIYFGEEYSTPVEYRFNEWMEIRIEVLGDRAQIFLDGGDPLLVIDDLKHETEPGAIGLFSGFAPARFANFRYEETEDVTIAPRPEPKEPRAEIDGLIREWSVSDAVPESTLAGVHQLPSDFLDGLAWHPLSVETNGVANLARIQSPRKAGNTAFARLVLNADQAAVQPLDFGFSDRVRVFVNGALVCGGSDMWRSRDYRFLGTVGLHDTVYCPLKPGRNEVLFAVSESFGGWAVMGRMPTLPGVRIVEE